MFQCSRRFFFICGKRTKILQSFVLSEVTLKCAKCLSCTSHIRMKDKTSISYLFRPIPVKSEEYESTAGEELAGKIEKDKIIKVLNSFYRKPELKLLAEENGLDAYILQNGFISFRKYCLKISSLPPDLYVILADIIKKAGNELDIFPYFLRHLREIFPHLECMEDLKKIGDLRSPPNWYPEARQIKRKIIYHSGPTNSGKTHAALNKFYDAKTGVYCGPLKLLAVEIFNKSNENGVECDLVTGEEIIYSNSNGDHTDHISCTVEMCPLEKKYDVAIIDEIQMIKDMQRGWAWTRALLGLRANEIHLCGEESAIDLVDSILCTTNEDLEVHRYERLTQLEVDDPVESMEKVRDGDCIVCFSKKDIFNVIEALEGLGKEVAVIYGTLPPGTKLAQCKKFNDPENPCKILVATDAVGMGLNLTIGRIIFYSLKKVVMNDFGEMEIVTISVSQALQIAGRAGRYNTRYEKGLVTTFKRKDFDQLLELMSKKPESVMSAGLIPTIDQIELYSFYLPQSSLSNLLQIFINLSTLDDSMYFLCDIKDFRYLAEMIEHIPLPLKVKYVFCSAPCNRRLQFTCSIFQKFAKMYSENSAITFTWLCRAINWPVNPPQNLRELVHLESVHDSLDLYLWLSNRFPDYFPDGESVRQIQREIDLIIQQGMVKIIKLIKRYKKNENAQEEKFDFDGELSPEYGFNTTSNEKVVTYKIE